MTLDTDVAAEVAAMGCTILEYHQITSDVATVFVICSRGIHARDILSWRYEDGAWRLVDFTPHAPGIVTELNSARW